MWFRSLNCILFKNTNLVSYLGPFDRVDLEIHGGVPHFYCDSIFGFIANCCVFGVKNLFWCYDLIFIVWERSEVVRKGKLQNHGFGAHTVCDEVGYDFIIFLLSLRILTHVYFFELGWVCSRSCLIVRNHVLGVFQGTFVSSSMLYLDMGLYCL